MKYTHSTDIYTTPPLCYNLIIDGGVLDLTGEAESVLHAVEHDHVKTGKALTAENNTFALPAAA